MDDLLSLLSSARPGALSLVAFAMLVLGAAAVAWPLLASRIGKADVKRRLRVEPLAREGTPRQREAKSTEAVRERAVKTAQDFYARTDPENVARLRLKLIQAGYMEPRAVGVFFLIRFVALVAAAIAAFVLEIALDASASGMSRWIFIAAAGIVGYFSPGLVLSRQVKERVREYRNGFPDFMDMMIVCADAGMSMEASIERVSKELGPTYPALSANLRLVCIELRAGRALDDCLKSLADRLNLDEVRSFATLLQQSKELGTSLSGALRVFSDEMRHKRMSRAEEKAHALPAKMSVPVTVCILPVVMMIAIIPVIVKMTMME